MDISFDWCGSCNRLLQLIISGLLNLCGNIFQVPINLFSVNCQQLSALNTPPLLNVERNWRILENEPVNTVVQRVTANDVERDNLEFGLEYKKMGNYDAVIDTSNDNDNIPFRIDENGVVYLNESLMGRVRRKIYLEVQFISFNNISFFQGGEKFLLYVTVFDGQLTTKNEVYVRILNANSSNASDYYDSRPPSFTPNAGNIHKLLPQLTIPNLSSPQLPPININLNNNPNSNANPILNKNYKYQTKTYPENIANNSNKPDEEETLLTKSSTIATTKLSPWKPNKNSNENNNSGNNSLISDKNSINDNNNKNIKTTTEQQNNPIQQNIISIIIVIGCIFVIAIIIIVIIFRKYLCAISRTMKKKNKVDKAKKSNQSQISSTLTTDDSHNSIVMQQWMGPTAFNNRYIKSWNDRDNINQHIQVTSQLSTGSSDQSNTNGSTKDRWEFPRHRLKVFNILGEGAFGQVWRCEATDIDGIEGVSTVAVKTIKENANESERIDLLSELQVMKSLESHVNVVRLLGCCTEKDPIFVIIEYVNMGKLQTYLRNSRVDKLVYSKRSPAYVKEQPPKLNATNFSIHRNYGNTHGKSKTLTSGDLTAFMYQVARGMDYLTARGIIHRDLAARNILITDDHTCKVADFGFARDVVTSKVYERKSEGRLPIR